MSNRPSEQYPNALPPPPERPRWSRRERIAVPVMAAVPLALIGLLSKAIAGEQCETISENVRFERCQELQHHPIWLFAPALVVLALGWLVAWRRPRGSFVIAAIFIAVLLAAAATFFAPQAWLSSAPAGGP